MGVDAAARLLRERAASYARDAEALDRGEHPEAVAILSTMRDELRKVASEIEHKEWCVECSAFHRPPIGCGTAVASPRLHGPGCVDCDNGVVECHRSRTDKPNRLRGRDDA